MKKIISWIFILIGLTVLVAGTSKTLYNKVHEKKYYELNQSWWGEHHSYGGDLVNMAYLDEIKKFQAPKDYLFRSPTDSLAVENTDLYMWGDSYVEDVPGYAFGHLHSFHFGRNYYDELHYSLDKNRRNVLIIESTERFSRPYFIYKSIYKTVRKKNDKEVFRFDLSHVRTDYALFGVPLGVNEWFNEHINQNIEFLLFNYNFLNKPRFLKADMNYRMFNRASGSVSISDDGNNLFLRETILAKHGYSCYEQLGDSTINWYVNELNNVYDHYKAEGFDEVYLSIIPNPATILQPKKYNNFIPRLFRNPGLRMPVIDVYQQFKNDPDPHRLFRPGDSHWNNNGMQIWLGVVNEHLRKRNLK